jgi:rhodanese-related sulfurtransferase
MKTILFSISFLFVLFPVSAQKVVDQTEFKTLIKTEGAQLVDVRTAKEYAQGKISGAVNIDYFSSSFSTAISKLDKKKIILVYCAAGGRSASAAKEFKKLGFKKVYDLRGGYDSWKD